MVFIDGVKYACATCIKGHRSTACQHSDRELFVIKRKGRPITQCSHCRELRKTQKVHVKCNCIERKRAESISSQSQTVAVLPQRIPVDDYQVTSGDKTSVEALLNPCQCLTGAKCICCRLDSSVIQYSNQNNSHFDKEFVKSDTMNVPSVNNDSSYLSASSAPTAIYTLPPISANLNQYQHIHSYDNNTVNESFNFIPSLNNNGGGYSEHINSSIAQRDSNSFTTSIVPLESRYSYIDNDETDFKPRDQSGILGEEICRSTSADLANIIYSSFRSCSPNAANGNCCVSDNNSTTMMPVCRCGPGCVCSGCDTHAERVNPKNSSSNCCSSYHEITQPEHKKIRDEDGVLLCGCGCQKLDTECSDCLKNLCEEYLLKP